MSSLDERIVLLAAALSPRSAASALESLPEQRRDGALQMLEQAREQNRLQWRRSLAEVLRPGHSRREAVIAAAGPLAPRLKQRLAQPRPDADPTDDPRERLLRRLVRECGG